MIKLNMKKKNVSFSVASEPKNFLLLIMILIKAGKVSALMSRSVKMKRLL